MVDIWKTHPISTCASLWYRHLSPGWTVHVGVPQTHLNFLLLGISPLCGLQQQHGWWQQRIGFSSQCRRYSSTEDTGNWELCSACGKGTCLKCKLSEFTVSKFVYDFHKAKSWDTWFRCSCQTGAAWRRERPRVQGHRVTEGSQFCHPGTPGLTLSFQRLMCTPQPALSQAPPPQGGHFYNAFFSSPGDHWQCSEAKQPRWKAVLVVARSHACHTRGAKRTPRTTSPPSFFIMGKWAHK